MLYVEKVQFLIAESLDLMINYLCLFYPMFNVFGE